MQTMGQGLERIIVNDNKELLCRSGNGCGAVAELPEDRF